MGSREFMDMRKQMLENYERELEAILGILKLKKGSILTYTAHFTEKIKKTPFQLKVLQEVFKMSEFPSTATRRDLSLLLSIPQRSVQVWFQNTRQAKRKYKENLAERGIRAESSDSEEQNDDVSLADLIRIIREAKRSTRGNPL
ncbi:hypothetical protein ENBRE01_1812 [Enteropsectra breve]|nr:hypothetical protein ENBRE01_1812 [Enteropsectra breve]